VDKTRISVCCVTAGPLRRVAAILALYRPVVDEIVCAVNSRFSATELATLEHVADRVVPCEMRADFNPEHYRAWAYGLCTGDWIVTVDSDEVPSAALLAALAALAARRDVVSYLATCRWLYPDASHVLDEYPWEPSWKIVMVRNDPATLHIKGGVHEGVMAVAPYRFVELPVYHLSCVVLPVAARRAKVAFYDSLDGQQLLEDGRRISTVFYLPEEHARFEPAPLPPEDVALVRGVLDVDISTDRVLERDSVPDVPEPLAPGAVSYGEIAATWPEHPFDPGAYRATLALRRARTPARELSPLAAGEIRPLMVAVRNDGTQTWLRDLRNRVALGSRWHARAPGGGAGELVADGQRSVFASDVRPGDELLQPLAVEAPAEPGRYVLVVDLVEEQVRWFGCGIEVAVDVTGTPDEAAGGR
jgi:DNA-binding transcriptional regulator YdaS (Cro superfamily)